VAPQPNPSDPYLVDLVRAWDRPRYVATLFAPAAARRGLFALYAFAAEVARVPYQVRETGLGEIRLQWWREAVERVAAGEPGETPVLRALAQAMAYHALPRWPLVELVDAYRDDLYADPPASRTELEGYLGQTQSALFQLASLILGSAGPQTADAAGHAGVAYGLTLRLAQLGPERAGGRVLIPADHLWEHGVRAEDVMLPEAPAGLSGAVSAMAALAESHLDEAVAALRRVGRERRAAFLPLAIVRPLLKRIRREGDGIATRSLSQPQLEVVSLITFAALAWPRGF
jgi:phytoene synthase